MSRQLEQAQEERARKTAEKLAYDIDYGLEKNVAASGGTLGGLSIKLNGGDVLMTLRARFPAGAMVAFVGSETIGGAVRKATRDASGDKLQWRVDKWAG